ncbi:MAG TPA: hypothetical protein VGF74_02600 [Thermoleophilaceae bacterium]
MRVWTACTAAVVSSLAIVGVAHASAATSLLPFPNNTLTVKDRHTPTGRRVHLVKSEMPRNNKGVPIDPRAYNRADGFSPGAPILIDVPGLNTPAKLAKIHAPSVNDVALSLRKSSPIVVVDEKSGKRQLVWAEVDMNATKPSDRLLEIHPGRNLVEGHTYLVVVRNVHSTAKAGLQRGPKTKGILRKLARAHVKRKGIFRAWDFTVASGRSIAGPLLSIRNDAFKRLGDTNLKDMKLQGGSPAFTVTSATDVPACDPVLGCQPGQDAYIARRVAGTVTVPCYLNEPGCPSGSRFPFRGKGLDLPSAGTNTISANFVCNIPRSASAAAPARPSLYGHGLFGSSTEINSTPLEQLSNEHDIMLCATDWIGMSKADIPMAITALQDLSKFPELTDRVDQSMVDFMYLGRTMIHPMGFAANPAFQAGGASLINASRLYYVGGSQGGIFGGTLTAVAPDFDRAVLAVPGMDYSVLLPRSVDFDQYAAILYPAYPDEKERPLVLSLIQQLWDRSDPDGFANHMTSKPYADTPAHKVFIEMAFGDHQVSNVMTEIEARTIGASLRVPLLDPGRSSEKRPFFGIPRIKHFPFTGNAIEVWDIGPLRTVNGQTLGTPTPPSINEPNRPGVDPHGPDASEQATGRQQASDFLMPDALSKITDVCGPKPCYLAGWTGP